MKLIKFGTIEGMEDGRIHVHGFNVNCEQNELPAHECILELAIDFLERELARMRQERKEKPE